MTIDEATIAATARPTPPRRAITMAVPLVVALIAANVGARTGDMAGGALWGLLAGIGILAGLRIGRIPLGLVDQGLLLAGLMASTVLATRVLPFAPETLDVLLCVKFALAWVPAGIASALVVSRSGRRPMAAINAAVLWLAAGAFSLPMAEVLGVLRPIDTLRRNQEPTFGTGEYVIVAMVVTALAVSYLLAVMANVPSLGVTAAVLTFTWFAGSGVGFSIPAFFGNIAKIVELPRLWPPGFTWAIGSGNWWWVPSWEFGDPFLANPLVETVRIAITATTLGCIIALPIAFMASKLTAPNQTAYVVDKGFLNVVRTIPDLFWALILVASVGFGPFAGAIALTVFSMSIMAKLLSETVDAADPGPLEAAKAAGGQHFPSVRVSVMPQVLPNYAALSLYIFELNLRASAVLGIVGAGGIGRVIEAQRTQAHFDRVIAVLVPLLVLVIIVEQISVVIRRRLI